MSGDEVAVDYGFVLVVLDTRTGRVHAMRDDQRTAWLERGAALRAAPPPTATTTIENLARLTPPPEVPRVRRWQAGIALSRAYAAGRIGFPATLALVTSAHRMAERAAGAEEAAEALAAVHTVAPLAPFRVRALDARVAALLLLRTARRTAGFRLGATVDPVRTHAWLEADGEPVGEEPWVSRYTAFPRNAP